MVLPVMRVVFFLASAFLLVVLPLVGVVAGGQPVGRYLDFPPLTRYVQHAPFNLLIFCAGVLVFLLVMTGMVLLSCRILSLKRDLWLRPFPWWGWGGIILSICTWTLAWNRFPWFSSLQVYTFTPLWLGYILSVNGVTVKRSGTCLMKREPRRFFLLFPVSAIFWWYFEWMNRFVQNWYYMGVEDFSALGYVLHASLCFSTVLPAVLSTMELLSTFLRQPGSCSCRKSGLKAAWSKRQGWLLLAIMAIVLIALPLVPNQLFPFVWIAPFFIIVGMQGVTGRQSIFSLLFLEGWQTIIIPALAALFCGFFWEMWNWKSLAHWEYSIPYVDSYHIFAMPILGYLGYLPFGLQCRVTADAVFREP